MLILSRKAHQATFVLIPGVPPIVVSPVRLRGDKARVGFEVPDVATVVRGELVTPELLEAHAATLAGGSFDAWLATVAAAKEAAKAARQAAGPPAPETEVELAEGCRILPASLVEAIREAEGGKDADAA